MADSRTDESRYPLLDLKPDRGLFAPIAPPQPGDFQVGDP